MQNLQHQIQQILTKYQKQHKHAFVAVMLSFLVAVSVCSCLIEPAMSMTTGWTIGSLMGSTGEYTAMERGTTVPNPATGSGGYFEEAETDIPDPAVNFGDSITSITINGTTLGSGSTSVDLTSGSDSLNITMKLTYKLTSGSISTDAPCIYYELPDGITIPSAYYGVSKTIVDGVYSSDVPAGYLSISQDGLIIIQFTDDYIEWTQSQGDYTGSVTFNGVISRAETQDGDQTINIGGFTINVDFPDVTNGVYKTASVSDADADGNIYITWKIEVTDYGYGLDGWTLQDQKFPSDVSQITVTPDGYGSFSEDGKSYVFTDTPTDTNKVTFTYVQKVTASELNAEFAADGQIDNTATIYDTSGNTQSSTGYAYLNKPVISKTGKADYETGDMDNKINWEITLNHPYGGSLNGYEIKDNYLSTAVEGSIVLTDQDGNTLVQDTDYTVTNGTIEILSDVSYVKLVYQTAATSGQSYNNTAHFYYPDNDSSGGNDGADVYYSDPFTISKIGGYDQDSGLITWTITYSCSEGGSQTLDGMVLSDDAFEKLTAVSDVNLKEVGLYWGEYADYTTTSVVDGKIVFTFSSWDGKDLGTATLDPTAKTLTFADGADGGIQLFKFSYQTTPTESELAAKSASNTVKDKTKSVTANVQLTTRSYVTKSLSSTSGGSNTAYGDEDNTVRTLNWNVSIVEDNGLYGSGNVLVDTTTSENAGADGEVVHYITKEQAAAIVVSAKKTSSDSYVKLTEGTDYVITFYDADGNAIEADEDGNLVWEITNEDGSVTEKVATSFQITFNESCDTAGYHYAQVTYASTADITGIVAGDTTSTTGYYYNQATYGDSSQRPSYGFTRYPSDYVEKTSVNVSKSWSDNSGSSQADITAALYYMEEGGSEWLPYPDEESQYVATLGQSNNWNTTWSDLPKTNSDRSKSYLYKVEEITAVDGYKTSYTNNDGVNGGYITITNTKMAAVEKYAADSSWNQLDSGSRQKADLETVELSGTTYYIFYWTLNVESGKYTSFTDTLPDGHTLYEEVVNWSDYTVQATWDGQGRYPFSGYTSSGNQLTLDHSSSNYSSIKAYFYRTLVPVDTVNNAIETDGFYTATNSAASADGVTDSATIEITDGSGGDDSSDGSSDSGGDGGTTSNEDTSLLHKNGFDSVVTGRIKYTILVNPDGKNLSNGDTYDLIDQLTLNGYTGLTEEQVAALKASLYEITAEKVEVTYEDGEPVVVDQNDDKTLVGTLLNANEFSYTLEEKPSVTETTNITVSSGTIGQYTGWVADLPANSQVTITLKGTPNAAVDAWTVYPRVYGDESSRTYEYNYIDISSAAYGFTFDENGEYTFTYTTGSTYFGLYDKSGSAVTGVEISCTTTTVLCTTQLNMTVPDETPVLLTYYFDVSGLPSWDSMQGGDVITASNKVSLDTGNVSSWDSVDNQEFIVHEASGDIGVDTQPKLYKLDSTNYSVTLNAQFKLAKYVASEDKWYFATHFDETVSSSGTTIYTPRFETEDGATITTAGNSNEIPADAYVFNIGDISINLSEESDVLYKMIEVSPPTYIIDGETRYYEGTNVVTKFKSALQAYSSGSYTGEYSEFLAEYVSRYGDSTTDEEIFERLLVMYHDSTAPEHPYKAFFDKFISTFYFTYGASSNYGKPSGFDESVTILESGSTLDVMNNALIDVTTIKLWDSTMDSSNVSADIALYWSYVKKSSGYPDSSSMYLANATDLGLIDESFSAYRTITGTDGSNTASWEDLPSAVNGRLVYYYIVETSYTVDGVTFYRQSDGTYQTTDGVTGEYKPIFTGNALTGSNGTVTAYNTKGLTISKVWKNSDNSIMSKPPVDSVPVVLYGISGTSEKKIETFTLESPSWELTIPDTYDLSGYTSFRVEEALDSEILYGYTISYGYNITGGAGTITITNKDSTPTAVSISARKAWGDGNDTHDDDSVTVELHRTVRDSNGTLTYSPDTPVLDTQVLNKENNWTYTWSTSADVTYPYKDEDGNRYFYYVIEKDVTVSNGVTYEVSYAYDRTPQEQIITVNNYIPGGLTIEKTWSGDVTDGSSAALPDSLSFKLYRAVKARVNVGEPAPSNLVVTAVGDSITYGSMGGDIPYPTVLKDYLEKDQYSGITVHNCGHNNYTISSIQGVVNGTDKTNVQAADVILVIAGTNDARASADSIETMISNYKKLIDDIYLLAGDDAIVMIGGIPKTEPAGSDRIYNGQSMNKYSWSGTTEDLWALWTTFIQDYNTELSKLAATYVTAGKNCVYVDTFTAVGDQFDDTDLIHPNTDGYASIAEAFRQAINTAYGVEFVEADLEENLSGVPADLETSNVYEQVTYNGESVFTMTPDTEGNWKLNFNDLPATDDDGNEYVYYAVETTTGYTTTYSGNGQVLQENGVVTVTVDNEVILEDLSFTVEKTWIDGDGASRPDALGLTLQRSTDGVNWTTLSNPTPTPTVNGNVWTYTYSDLPAEDDNGNAYIYQIAESVPTGYSVAIENNSISKDTTDKEVRLTNTKVVKLNITKVWTDGDNHLADAVEVLVFRSKTINPAEVPLISGDVQSYSWMSMTTNSYTALADGADLSGSSNIITTLALDSTRMLDRIVIDFSQLSASTWQMGATTVSYNGTNLISFSDMYVDSSGTVQSSISVNSDQVSYTIVDDVITITFTDVAADQLIICSNKPNQWNCLAEDYTYEVYYASEEESSEEESSEEESTEASTESTTTTTTTTATTESTTSTTTTESTTSTTTTESTTSTTESTTSTTESTTSTTESTTTATTASSAGGGADVVTTFMLDYSGDETTFTIADNTNVVGIDMALSHASGQWEYVTLKFDGNNYVKAGWHGDSGFEIEGGSSSKMTNFTAEIVNSVLVITFDDGYTVPETVTATSNGSSTTVTLTIHYNAGAEVVTTTTETTTTTTTTESTTSTTTTESTTSTTTTESTTSSTSTTESPTSTTTTESTTSSTSTTESTTTTTSTTIVAECIATLTLKDSNSWTQTLEDLPAYDTDGNPYYYWIVEKALPGYTTAYSFPDSDDNTIYCINAGAIGDEATLTVENTPTDTSTVLPSTGGEGTQRIYLLGFALCSGAIAGLFLKRGRRKRAA